MRTPLKQRGGSEWDRAFADLGIDRRQLDKFAKGARQLGRLVDVARRLSVAQQRHDQGEVRMVEIAPGVFAPRRARNPVEQARDLVHTLGEIFRDG